VVISHSAELGVPIIEAKKEPEEDEEDFEAFIGPPQTTSSSPSSEQKSPQYREAQQISQPSDGSNALRRADFAEAVIEIQRHLFEPGIGQENTTESKLGQSRSGGSPVLAVAGGESVCVLSAVPYRAKEKWSTGRADLARCAPAGSR
jgi:hypothetical protein